MKPRILYLQFRHDFSREHEESMIIQKTGLTRGDFRIVNTIEDEFEDDPNKLLEGISCVITGASAQYDLSKKPEPVMRALEKVKNTLNYLVEQDIPTFGICFAHHVWAEFLGGKVEQVPVMAETGTFKVYLTDEGKKSPIFYGVKSPFSAIFGHKDSVTKLPKPATLLAYTDRCPVAAYRIGKNIYTVQFHPELDKEAVIWRVRRYPEYAHGEPIDDIVQGFYDSPDGQKVLNNFLDMYLVGGRNGHK